MSHNCAAEQMEPAILEMTDQVKRLRAEIATLRATLDEAFGLNQEPVRVTTKVSKNGTHWLAWAPKR